MSRPLPVVAIVGQTNAGKSSLFNRLTGSRNAIVAREEGTTRDNVSAHVDERYLLLDTAGMKLNPEDDFEESIQDQIAEAVASADLIVLALDSTKYLTPPDLELAKSALKSGKSVIAVLNKVDLREALPDEEFVSMGVKELYRVSATTGAGIHDLRERLARDFPVREMKEKDEVLTLALIGRPNVGKSSLFNSMLKKQQAVVSSKAGTTRDLNRGQIKYHGRPITVIDTAGLRRPGKREVGVEKFSAMRSLLAIDEADICALLIDGSEPSVALDKVLAGEIINKGKGLIIVITKLDLPEVNAEEVLGLINRNLNFIHFAPVILTSSMSGRNVAKIFELATKIDEERQIEIKTSDLNKILAEAIMEKNPVGPSGKNPRPRYITQTDTSPPWFVVQGADMDAIHGSWKRFLERKIREQYPFFGTPIKFEFREGDKK